MGQRVHEKGPVSRACGNSEELGRHGPSLTVIDLESGRQFNGNSTRSVPNLRGFCLQSLVDLHQDLGIVAELS
jgi:hypothetical protein